LDLVLGVLLSDLLSVALEGLTDPLEGEDAFVVVFVFLARDFGKFLGVLEGKSSP
jgi:hypothetical protein